MWGLAAECGLFRNQLVLPVLIVTIMLVFSSVGTLSRVAFSVQVASLALLYASLYSANLYEMNCQWTLMLKIG